MEISTAILILIILVILVYVNMLNDAYRSEIRRLRQSILDTRHESE